MASSSLCLGTLSDTSHGLKTCWVATSVKNGKDFSIACGVPSKVYDTISLSDKATKFAPTC